MDAILNGQSIQDAIENLWANAAAEIQQEYVERSRERVAHRQIVVDAIVVEEVWFDEEDGEEHPDEYENDDGYESDCTLAEWDYSSDEETDVEDETVQYAIDPEEDFVVDDGFEAMDLMMAETADLEEALNWGVQFLPVPNNGEDGQPIPFEIGFYY